MYDPPPGYGDLAADAAAAPWPVGEPVSLEVAGHRLAVYRPAPRAAVLLADIARHRAPSSAEQWQLIMSFVTEHLADGEQGYSALLRGMMDDLYPADMVMATIRGIVTMGTARSMSAVMTLVNLVGHHWRTVRVKLVMAGVTDPMALPSLHVLLDVIESIVVESMSDGTKEGQEKVTKFFDSVYRPEIRTAVSDDGWKPPPSGFSPEEIAEVERLSRASR